MEPLCTLNNTKLKENIIISLYLPVFLLEDLDLINGGFE